MTGEKFIALAEHTLYGMLDAERDPIKRDALGFVLANWHKFEPANISELREGRRLQTATQVVLQNATVAKSLIP